MKNSNIKFRNKKHEERYVELLKKVQNDSYHRAVMYLYALCDDCYRNVQTLFNFKKGSIKPSGLIKPWQTEGSKRVTRLALNLYNGFSAELDESGDCIYNEEGDWVCSKYFTPDYIFCCGDAPYFWEAIKLRFPDETMATLRGEV